MFCLGYGLFENLNELYGNELKNGSYRRFIFYLKPLIPNDNRVRLNSEAIRLKYLQKNHRLFVHIRNRIKKSEQLISTIMCDHMIWTSSLSYLKENFPSIFADEIKLVKQKKKCY